jgi:prepilin-type N-terminal cleavage/methylation domain-containing protein/prepilin-type processing-associated H-X9-DG protein
MQMRRRGFTLIELLVVIAIIGILAAMLFPVFARARESARKVQCLANVKNLAMAIQIYLTDYDATPPTETRPEVVNFFNALDPSWAPENCNRSIYGNPYLRWPVIMDEYTKSREIWSCPSAKLETYAREIVPDYYPGGWFGYWQYYQSSWGSGLGPCYPSYPPGWGGDVTDSMLQRRTANVGRSSGGGGTGTFHFSISMNEMRGIGTSRFDDASSYVIVSETGIQPDAEADWRGSRADFAAYPDVCAAGCPCQQSRDNGADCSWAAECGSNTQFRRDSTLRAKYARHLGGNNLGFADGHATWMPAERVLSQAPRWAQCKQGTGIVERELKGLQPAYFTTAGGDTGAGIAPGWVDPCLASNGWATLY